MVKDWHKNCISIREIIVFYNTSCLSTYEISFEASLLDYQAHTYPSSKTQVEVKESQSKYQTKTWNHCENQSANTCFGIEKCFTWHAQKKYLACAWGVEHPTKSSDLR